jgi:hypothetical protein
MTGTRCAAGTSEGVGLAFSQAGPAARSLPVALANRHPGTKRAGAI